ncbi:hypothetical protein [Mycobacterium sp. MAA66]|uniref:hypothetical protein n=1 Tax=Mycobacterium sp. MAA66 TaxID=3156297 RepID=UPI0035129298
MQAALTAADRLADALQQFAEVNAIPRLLPVVSGLQEASDPHDPVRDYLAVRRALAETSCLAAELADGRIDAWLACEAVALVAMAAAVAVVESAGVPVDRGTDARSQLNRARYWRGYSRGPVTDLHRRCGQDITRGSLRMLAGHRPAVSDARLALQRARLQLVDAGRARCGALRRDVLSWPLTGRGGRTRFEQRVRARSAYLFEVADVESARQLAEIVDLATTPWRMPTIPDPPAGPRTDERWLGAVLGAGFGMGVALAAMRLMSGLAGVAEAGAAVFGLLVGLGLSWWVVAVRGRLQARAALDRWVADVIGAVRQASEYELARRWLDAGQHLAERRPPTHHKSRN